jgi:hypothetical protein
MRAMTAIMFRREPADFDLFEANPNDAKSVTAALFASAKITRTADRDFSSSLSRWRPSPSRSIQTLR